jgi:hypothetical protein
MARVAPKVSKALGNALYKHRIDPIKFPAAPIIKKFELKNHTNFYRAMYHAVMQQA